MRQTLTLTNPYLPQCKTKLHHGPYAPQCVYGCSDERGEDGDWFEISEGGKRVEIAWPLVCRSLGSVW